jgi:hypothetical protein
MKLRILMLVTATALVAGSAATGSFAQSAGVAALPPADLNPTAKPDTDIRIDTDTLRSTLAPGALGLRPNSAPTAGAGLPLGLRYSGDAKSVIMPLDEKNEWGVGLNFNLNSPPPVELAPNSALGLQPKRSPGVMLQRRF